MPVLMVVMMQMTVRMNPMRHSASLFHMSMSGLTFGFMSRWCAMPDMIVVNNKLVHSADRPNASLFLSCSGFIKYTSSTMPRANVMALNAHMAMMAMVYMVTNFLGSAC